MDHVPERSKNDDKCSILKRQFKKKNNWFINIEKQKKKTKKSDAKDQKKKQKK